MGRTERTLAEWSGAPQPSPGPPRDYRPEATTVWSFPKRGDWADHRGDYPGNWSPFVPRNLVQRYSGPGELVLDPMMGSGTTLVECALLGRRAQGYDLYPEVVANVHARVRGLPGIVAETGDARNLPRLHEASVDLVTLHPPYGSIIAYGKKANEADLSRQRGTAGYLDALGMVARECLRVLKPGRHCAVMLGDTRQRRHFVPLAFLGMVEFLRAGFVLKEDIIKLQWNMRGSVRWRNARDFYLIAHEHVFVFRKVTEAGESRATRWSGPGVIARLEGG